VIQIFAWLNENQGVVSSLIFAVTIFLGWVSGIFGSLRRKPKLRLQSLPGPTFCSTFPTGNKQDGHDTHRTAICLYLNIANVGSAPTSVDNVEIGYHWHVQPFSLTWLRYRVCWFWLRNQVAMLQDFQIKIGDHFKVFPSLFQRSTILGDALNTYLEIGRSVNGVVYFEQTESWGGCFPTPRQNQTKVRVAVTDVFGKKHKESFWIPIVTLDQAKKYNPSFGETLLTLQKDKVSHRAAPQTDMPARETN
jgi:hypothetical protein